MLRRALPVVMIMAVAAVAGLPVQAATVPVPVPAPGGPQNIFYNEANPAVNANAPVIIFVHGLGSTAAYFFQSGNEMYLDAYNAGFRAAFVSLNADNSNDHNSIQYNAQQLQLYTPTILQHFGVSQAYFVGHSEGGLDIELAMADATFRSYVKAVFTISTPNQGTALADWAYGPGKKLLGPLGGLTPGLQDLQPELVAPLRAQLDPIFATAGIPFFYLAGSQYSGQKSVFYDITGPILKNLTNGDDNDGLVAVSENYLPDSYAEDMGAIKVDHTNAGFGQNSWDFIYGRFIQLENRGGNWQKIASGGFGDDGNTWIWSQQWFQGNLYVGTARQVNCIIDRSAQEGSGLPLYPPPGNDCPTDPAYLGTGAEIWRYTPQTKTWTRVYKAPQTVPIGTDLNGNPAFAATAVGFRSMTVYTESDGTQALYVGGVSPISIYSTLPQYSNNSYPPPPILRSTDGVNFNPIPMDPGTFLGDIVANNTDIQVASFRSIVQTNGGMFIDATDFRGQGFIIASANPSQGDNAFERVSPAPATPGFAVWVLAQYNGTLYVGTGDRTNNAGYGVYYTNNQIGDPTPFEYTPVVLDGGWQPDSNLRSPTALTFHVWQPQGDTQQHLYVGTDRKIEILRVNPDNTWDLVMGQPRSTPDGFKAPLSGIGYYFDNNFDGHIWQMQSSSEFGLYASTWDWSVMLRTVSLLQINAATTAEEGFDFYRTPDGVNFYLVSKDGLGDGLNMGGRSGNSNHFGMFWGTARPTGGTQEWQDPSILDLNGDGKIDQLDANIIQAAIGQTATTPFDARDVNGNGVIDAQDVQFLESQCTFTNCSVTPPAGTGWTPPPTPFQGFVQAQTLLAVGNQAVLTWPAQPNAVRYHIYRYTSTPALQILLGGAPNITVQLSQTFNVTVPNQIVSGALATACPANLDDYWACSMADAVQNAVSGGSSGPGQSNPLQPGQAFPAPLEEIAQTTQPSYSESMPTGIQSLYYVRSEDANGNLSATSNIVGAPSFTQVPGQ